MSIWVRGGGCIILFCFKNIFIYAFNGKFQRQQSTHIHPKTKNGSSTMRCWLEGQGGTYAECCPEMGGGWVHLRPWPAASWVPRAGSRACGVAGVGLCPASLRN